MRSVEVTLMRINTESVLWKYCGSIEIFSMCVCIYIYIYIFFLGERSELCHQNIVDGNK